MRITISLVLFYFLAPVLLIYLTHISKTINKIGAVVMAYLLGLLFGNIGILPRASEAFRALLAGKAKLPAEQVAQYFDQGTITGSDVVANQVFSIQDMIMTIVIPLAIPLLLFSLDMKRWLKLAREAMFSMVLGLVSLLIVIFAGYFLFHDKIAESWKVAGMLIGVYTGGTPNLAAIATAVDVSPNTFILTHTYDLVLGALCLFFILTLAQRTFNLFLPHFHENHKHIKLAQVVKESEGVDNYIGMLTKRGALQLGKALLLSVLIFAIGGALSLLVSPSAQMVTVILTITTLGLIIGSLKSVSRIEKTFQLGMYFIIVFSLVVSSMADLSNMFRIDFLHLFIYVAIAVFGSMIVHVGLSWIFKVDSDTTIITITALTYSPPFVPVVASALKNKEVIISGLTIGILGYAFGNYLGVGIAFLLKGF
ncbi:MAG: DUF819 family protein [Prolixibacteraceae bacterium]|jgi:uncharacterized membrane protein|nr:DUF819 family protein [Prolixibacteraceae bacterium]